MKRRDRIAPFVPGLSAFAGFRFPPEAILLAVRWYLRVRHEALLAERR